jgi:hypothetical protein
VPALPRVVRAWLNRGDRRAVNRTFVHYELHVGARRCDQKESDRHLISLIGRACRKPSWQDPAGARCCL